MKETPVRFRGPYIDYQNNENFMVLQEVDGTRLCYITVDPFNGRSMALEANGQVAPRPSIHRLYINILNDFKLVPEKVIVTETIDNLYHAVICIKDENGVISNTDSGPSDAIIIALIKKCPIMINDKLLSTDETLRKNIDEANAVEASSTGGKRNETMTDKQAIDYLNSFDTDKLTKH